jgi:hypothetical protein
MSLSLINSVQTAVVAEAADQANVTADQAKLTADQAIALTDAGTVTVDNQALHDFLSANGPEFVPTFDTGTPPALVSVTVYTAVDPGSFSATVVKAAT